MNKYQKSLDYLTGKYTYKEYQVALDYLAGDYTYDAMEMWDESVKVIQELINNYAKLEKALEKACQILEDNENQIAIIMDDGHCYLPQFLDGLKTGNHEMIRKEQWKDWCLKDEEL